MPEVDTKEFEFWPTENEGQPAMMAFMVERQNIYQRKKDEFLALPEEMQKEWISHAVRLGNLICLELELAGMVVTPKISDGNIMLGLEFNNFAEICRFQLIASSSVEYPSGVYFIGPVPISTWEIRTGTNKPSFYIPVTDLSLCHQMLKIWNAEFVDGYEEKKQKAIERTGCVDV